MSIQPRAHNRNRLSLDSLPPAYCPHSPDRPPDYLDCPDHNPNTDNCDSADEADEEDEEEPEQVSQLQLHRRTHFPARLPARYRHNIRSPSIYTPHPGAASDTYLDSLLERSVHALEMSNALLQSNSSYSHPHHRHQSVRYERTQPHRRYRENATRPRNSKPAVNDPWMKELTDLAVSVDELFGNESRQASDNGQGISTSLPSSNFYMPLLSSSKTGPLQYGYNDSAFKSSPSRQTTQYTSAESTNVSLPNANDPAHLPCAVGSRSAGLVSQIPSSSSSSPRKIVSRRSYSNNDNRIHTGSAGTSPAHSLLSQIGGRQLVRSTSLRKHPSFEASRTIGPGRQSQASNSSRESPSSSRQSMSPLPSLEIRPMTPPIEELTPPSSESSTPATSQALERLRKILHDAPDNNNKKPKFAPPPLMIQPKGLSSAPPIESNTTASISRLLTKGTHRSSTSAPPPKQSSLKLPLSPLLSSGQSTPISSGRSTPRHKVQFAELPESYSSSKPGGSSRSKSGSSGGKKGAKGKGKGKGDEDGGGGWWKTFWGAGDLMAYSGRSSRFEDRIEDRVARSWGRPPFGAGGLDEWSIQ